jgi:NAD(P)H-quinone oxidoreductase subunit 5
MEQFLLQTIWVSPLYGLIGAVLSLPWSTGMIRLTGQRPAAYLNILFTFVSFVHAAIAFSYAWGTPSQSITFHWLKVADLDLSLALEVSPLSLGAAVLVAGLSFLAQVYALGYMEKDWSLGRFYGLMGFFEAALIGIALSDSLLLSYGLLELLTLSTYLLVGFWYAQPLVVTAARDAFLTKRVGDILLLMGIVALSSYGEGLSFSELQTWAENSSLPALTAALIGLALIAGPTGKCAQFPLNLWLDEAMEGPNPAGILRNSIVVSAGAYVLIKLEPVFTLSPVSADALIVIGTLTAIGASLVSIAQIDIKRTLSHSTSAYLGLVFVAVGLGQVDIALLLLLTHAIAKSLQFMSIGSIIFTTSGQNITEMGGLWSRMPATTVSFAVGSLGLVVLLPLGSFWSFQRWSSGQWEFPLWLLALVLLVNFLSVLNFTRVFRLVFCGQPQPKTRRAPEVPWPMAVPMVTLSIIVVLFVSVPLKWSLWLSATPPIIHGDMTIPRVAMPLLVLSGVAGLLLGLSIDLRRSLTRSQRVPLRLTQDFLAYDFYIEKLYDVTVVQAVSLLSKFTAWFDQYVVDGAVNLVGFITVLSGQALKYSVSGQSQFYVLTILIGVGLIFLLSMDLLNFLV